MKAECERQLSESEAGAAASLFVRGLFLLPSSLSALNLRGYQTRAAETPKIIPGPEISGLD
jgi:hypothetical protein